MGEASYYAEQFFPEHGIRTLAIVERFEDEEEAYVKRLFCRDGALYESYTSEERGFDPPESDLLSGSERSL